MSDGHQTHAIHMLFRKTIRRNFNYAGTALTSELCAEHDGSFVYLFNAARLDSHTTNFLNYKRDFDILPEGLGIDKCLYLIKTRMNSQFSHYSARYCGFEILFGQRKLCARSSAAASQQKDQLNDGKWTAQLLHVAWNFRRKNQA